MARERERQIAVAGALAAAIVRIVLALLDIWELLAKERHAITGGRRAGDVDHPVRTGTIEW